MNHDKGEMMGHANHDWPEMRGHCVPCLIENLDAANLQIGELKQQSENHRVCWMEMTQVSIDLRTDLDNANRLIGLWQEYAAFLGENVGNLALFAATHGWKCPSEVAAKGSELRAKLGVDDNWQLIEKRVVSGPKCAECGQSSGHSARCIGSMDV